MQITDVRVFPVRDEKLKAFVSVVFESCFMVNDIKVIRGRDGYFISMPSRRKKNGDYKDVAHPLNTETRLMLEERILDEYEQVVALDEPATRRYQGRGKKQKKDEGKADRAPQERRDSRSEGADKRQVSAVEEPVRETSEPAALPESPVESEQPPAPAPAAGAAEDDRTDLDEVVKDHLSDSFWSAS